ncbi:MAG: protein kinase domain-containing protein [Candidatus Geothermincolia bacterium]
MSDTKGPRYKIDREIGRGAFGVVYLAHDNVLRRNVALKVMTIPDGLTADERKHLVDRFYREARAAAGLSHANIVIIHDISKANEKHFISMELLEGEPLSQAVAGEPLPLARALRIADNVLAALEYAHAHEVVHRDIKPDNIFLLQDDTVKIVDFGLARVQASTTITQSGTVMGSPGYIAPEVIDGKPADKRTDVFSFGVVLYEMLTGERPFGPRDAFESFVRVIYRIMSEEQPAPSSKNPDIPPEVDALMEKLLAKDPDNRFQDAGEVREALAELAKGLDLEEQALPNPRKPARKEKKKSETGAALAEAAAALTVSDPEVEGDRERATKTEILQFEEDMRSEGSKPRTRRRLVLLLVGGGLVVLAGAAVLVLFLVGVFGPAETSVPNVVNLAEADAVSAIKKAGLKAGDIKGVFAYDIWKGKVATQKPSAGTKVPKNSSVELSVSLGPEVAQVPDVVGQPQDQAAATIRAFTFQPKIVDGYSETVTVGCVISESPAPGTLRAKDDIITLVVNNGVRPPNYKRPPVQPKRSTPVPPVRQ